MVRPRFGGHTDVWQLLVVLLDSAPLRRHWAHLPTRWATSSRRQRPFKGREGARESRAYFFFAAR